MCSDVVGSLLAEMVDAGAYCGIVTAAVAGTVGALCMPGQWFSDEARGPSAMAGATIAGPSSIAAPANNKPLIATPSGGYAMLQRSKTAAEQRRRKWEGGPLVQGGIGAPCWCVAANSAGRSVA